MSAARTLTLSLALLFATLVLAPLALAAEPGPSGAEGATAIGHVSRVQGTSFIARGQQLRDVVVGAPVLRGESIRTGPKARVELTMLDETRLTLGADTVFDLERYDLGRQRGEGAVLVRLTKGAFRAVTGKLDALRGGPFEVSTPLATIGIRGTDFWGGSLDGGEINLLLISGKGVYLRTDAGVSEIVKPGYGLTVRSRGEIPPAPSMWAPEKAARAFATVAFD